MQEIEGEDEEGAESVEVSETAGLLDHLSSQTTDEKKRRNSTMSDKENTDQHRRDAYAVGGLPVFEREIGVAN